MSYTPFNAPLLAGLFGDREIASYFSVAADVDAMVCFEGALAQAQGQVGLIGPEHATAIEKAIADFEPDLKALALGTQSDGVTPPELVRQLKAHVGEKLAPFVHVGTTSQDLIDTSLMMRLSGLFPVLSDRLGKIIARLEDLGLEQGDIDLMAHTRMQRALPIKVQDKISMWVEPMWTLRKTLPKSFPLQLGGPEGALMGMGDDAGEVAILMGKILGLSVPVRNWQTDRQPIIDCANWAVKLTTALGKIGQDIALLSQNEVAEVTVSGGGKSSAMAHKNNPVLAESLVTLARFNATMIGGLHQAALHENERSGTAWPLEWMLLPQLIVATGASLRNAQTLLNNTSFNSAA